MEEYRKIDWRTRDLTDHETRHQFIADEYLDMLYIYKGLDGTEMEKNAKFKETSEGNEPYVPGRKLITGMKSLLTKKQQAQCLAALKCLQSNKDPSKFSKIEQTNIEVYKKLQSKISEENVKYSKYALNVWKKNCSSLTGLKRLAYKYIKERWKRHTFRYADYKQFYKNLKMVSLSYTDEDPAVEVVMKENILEVGSLAKCTLPTLACAFTLKASTLPNEEERPSVNSKLPVSRDKNVSQMLCKYPIDVVISSGALHKILDNTDFDRSWDIPVIVKEVETEEGTTKLNKNIVFIDKPLPPPNPTKADFSKTCHKLLLRSNVCQFEAFKFPGIDLPMESEDVFEAVDTTEDAKPKLHHNVSYRLWSLSNKIEDHNVLMKSNVDKKTVNLLVRIKLDGCEPCDSGALQPVIVVPKLEYQLNFGGTVATKGELSKQWTSLFFRPFSKLYRVRIDGVNNQIVMSEKCTMQRINTEAMALYGYKPHLSLGILYRVCVELSSLTPGNYLLHHVPKQGSFVGIFEECNSDVEGYYDLYETYNDCIPHLTVMMPWCPIDNNLILPMHEAYQRMPGLFSGKDFPLQTGKGKKKKKKGVKKKNSK